MMKIFSMLLMAVLLPLQEHDIHVSVCDIEVEGSQIEITFKTFLDDLQLAMGLVPGEDLPDRYTSSDEMISDYILSTNTLKINDKKGQLIISSIDASADAVWISIISNEFADEIINLEWSSTFLTELYDDQTNIVNIKHAGKKKIFTLDDKKTMVNRSLSSL